MALNNYLNLWSGRVGEPCLVKPDVAIYLPQLKACSRVSIYLRLAVKQLEDSGSCY